MTAFIFRFAAAASLIAVVGGCSASGPTQDGSFELECSGRGAVEMRDYDKDETRTQPTKLTQLFLYWDAAGRSLRTRQAPLEAEDFCYGEGQESCSAQIEGDRLSAKSLEMLTGSRPDEIKGFEEEIDVDLGTLKGRYFTRQGTVTDRAGEMIRHSKLEIDTPLSCRQIK